MSIYDLPKIDKTRIGIIGSGRIGTNIAYWLSRDSKWHIQGIYDIDTERARKAAHTVPTGIAASVKQLFERCEAVIIAVPDSAINSIIEDISEFHGSKVHFIFHTCGALSSRILAAAGNEYKVASIHPALPVPTLNKKKNPFVPSKWSVEGDHEAVVLGEKIIKALGGSFIEIDPAHKSKYHAACCLLSNNIFALLQTGKDIFLESGMSDDDANEMINNLSGGALNNFLSSGLEHLTGPAVRNDYTTVLKHFSTLSGDQRDLYKTTLKSLPGMENFYEILMTFDEE